MPLRMMRYYNPETACDFSRDQIGRYPNLRQRAELTHFEGKNRSTVGLRETLLHLLCIMNHDGHSDQVDKRVTCRPPRWHLELVLSP
jgi:hypothetical protein